MSESPWSTCLYRGDREEKIQHSRRGIQKFVYRPCSTGSVFAMMQRKELDRTDELLSGMFIVLKGDFLGSCVCASQQPAGRAGMDERLGHWDGR